VEWGKCLSQWLDIYGAGRGLVATPAVLFPPMRRAGTTNPQWGFPQHNVPVIPFPPHMTHVMQPVDTCWAWPFKSETADAWNRHLTNPGVVEAAFAELKEDMRKASEKHRVRVRVLFSVYEAAQATTVASFASQGFWHAGLVPRNVSRPMGSPYNAEGPLPGPFPRGPFDGPAELLLPRSKSHLDRRGLFPMEWFRSYWRMASWLAPSAADPVSGSTGARPE
jgi:hypothetical protein